MMNKLTKIKFQALELLFRQGVNLSFDLSDFSRNDWIVFENLLTQHRLEALFFWRVCHEMVVEENDIPDELLEKCKKKFQSGILFSLLIQRELVYLSRLFDKVGIKFLALKGASLLFCAYPNPALRPMRDLDILVSEDNALQAYQALIDAGYSRSKNYKGDYFAWMELQCKHLPPLVSPYSALNIELHRKLYSSHLDISNDFDLSHDQIFWTSSISNEVCGTRINYEAPTDLFLHLIIHAVYDHQFTNGPLVISDLIYILSKNKLDWGRFWSLAESGGHIKGCVLILLIVEQYALTLEVDWSFVDGSLKKINPEVIDSTRELLFRDFDLRQDVTLRNTFSVDKGFWCMAKQFLFKIFPPKLKIASIYPVPKDSNAIYFFYVIYFFYIIFKRLPVFIKSNTSEYVKNEDRFLRILNGWLR